MSTNGALRYTMNAQMTALHQHLQAQGDTTEVIMVPPASPQHQHEDNNTSSLIPTKWPQKVVEQPDSTA